MSNDIRPILKTKIPYANDDTDLTEAFNYAVKTINSTFIEFPTQEVVAPITPPVVPPLTELGIIFSQSISSGDGIFLGSFTFTHSFGFTPKGWIVTDLVYPSNSRSYGTITRDSWTSSQITITISVDTASTISFSGSFTILVLR